MKLSKTQVTINIDYETDKVNPAAFEVEIDGAFKAFRDKISSEVLCFGYEVTNKIPEYTLRIETDDDPINPRVEYDRLGHMVCLHKRYNLGDEHGYKQDDYNSWDELQKAIMKETPGCEILPIYMLDNSSITISTKDFCDRWDSRKIGFIYMTREAMLLEAPVRQGHPVHYVTKRVREWAKEYLISEVAEYDQYLQGDCWGYIIECDGEEVDACWGMYGEEYCRSEGEAALKRLLGEE